jgi:hypothetical protein
LRDLREAMQQIPDFDLWPQYRDKALSGAQTIIVSSSKAHFLETMGAGALSSVPSPAQRCFYIVTGQSSQIAAGISRMPWTDAA